MHSFQTTPDAPACGGVIAANVQPDKMPVLRAVPSLAPKAKRDMVPYAAPQNERHEAPDTLNDHYYPHLAGLRYPVRCEPGQMARIAARSANAVRVHSCLPGNAFRSSEHWRNAR